MNMKSCIWAHS